MIDDEKYVEKMMLHILSKRFVSIKFDGFNA